MDRGLSWATRDDEFGIRLRHSLLTTTLVHIFFTTLQAIVKGVMAHIQTCFPANQNSILDSCT
jgi:hypothetical protein